MYHSFTPKKAQIVERVQKTIKGQISKSLAYLRRNNWISVIDEIVHHYNYEKVHRTTGFIPAQVNNRETEKKLQETVYNYSVVTKKPKFKINDAVRVNLYRSLFAKSYQQTFSHEIFLIDDVNRKYPIYYKLRDIFDVVLAGTYYEQELKPAKKVLMIEKFLPKAQESGKILVKFFGYEKPQIIREKNIIEDNMYLLKQ